MAEAHEPQDLPVRFEDEADVPEVQWRVTLGMFYANKAAVLGVVVLAIILIVGLFGPLVMQADPFAIVGAPLTEPGEIRLLGTDYLGRDIFAGMIYGTRPTLIVALTATAFTVVIGISVGALAGFYGGKIDNLLMRITEFFQVLPPLVFAMVIVAIMGTHFVTVIVAIAVTTWTNLARLTRAEFLKIKEREFVLADRAIGVRDSKLILRVLLPNALPPLIIAVTLQTGLTIIYEAALSFLGLTDPDIMTWGKMIGLSRDFFFDAWWSVTFPGLAILLTTLCIALIGDGLNDAFNPRLRGR